MNMDGSPLIHQLKKGRADAGASVQMQALLPPGE